MNRIRPRTDRWTDQEVAEYQARIGEVIKKYGWMVQGVFPTGPADLGFAYTIGLTEAGLPELIISGTYDNQAKNLLNSAARQHASNEFAHGDTVDGIANVPFRAIDAPEAPINIAHQRYGSRVRAVQLVWPDANGRWPGSVFAPPSDDQDLDGKPWW